jgi:AraC-like DNA-binding protein
MTQVSMVAVRALAAAVEGVGVERTRFLAEAGLAPAQIENADARVSLADYARARRAALATSGDPALGLHMGEHPSVGAYDVLGSLAEHSRSLREALHMCIRYARIMVEGPRMELTESGESATVRFTQLDADGPEARLTAEFATSGILYLIRRFIGIAAQPQRVPFTYPAPAHRAEYTRVFSGCEQFEQDITGIQFQRSWLDRAHVYRSPELCALLQSRAELLLARIEQEAPAADRVKRWLASHSLETKPKMDTIARDLGMSARSLRRRLHDEHAPYDALVEDARTTRAKGMLADPRHSVQEAAYALGFATSSAFSRAFKRWTGVAPSVYREARWKSCPPAASHSSARSMGKTS